MQQDLHLEKSPRVILRHFNAIKALADSEKDGLGFLPEQALRDAIDRRKMLVLLDQSRSPSELAGYLLYSGVYPHAKVQQIATVRPHRNQGLGSTLINCLVKELEDLGFMTVRADVASDLTVALAFYAKNGFVPIRTQAGGASRQRAIIVHSRDLDTDTLFNRTPDKEHEIDFGIRRRSAGETPFFALDLNVYLDLSKQRSHSDAARRLFGAALAHEIRLVIADEFIEELKRTSQDTTDDPILQLALRLPRMPGADLSQQRHLRDELYDLIFLQKGTAPSAEDRALSDATHLAHATLARASAFVTRDGRVLDARAAILSRFGIDVLTVDELLELLPADQMPRIGWPQIGRNFVCEKVNGITIRKCIQRESLPTATMEEFGTDGGQLFKFERLVVRRDKEIVAFSVLKIPREAQPVCRVFIYSRPDATDDELYCDHLLDVLLREASRGGATTVELECLVVQSALSKLAKARGFVKRGNQGTLIKIVMGRPVTGSNWLRATQELRIRTGLLLPARMPSDRDAEAFTIRAKTGKSRSVSLSGLESVIGPTLLIRPDRDGVIVPINRAYSRLLLGPGRQLSLGLTDDPDAAFQSTRAYINTPRAAKVMRPDMPILFYESMRSGGTGGIVAVGRIVDSIILGRKEISSNQQRQMVVEDINSILTGDEVLITTFSNLFTLPNPVSFTVLRTMGAIDGANLVSAKGISGGIVTQIMDIGWQNE